jgi:hypothetical protein
LQSPPICDTHCRKFLSPPAALRQGTCGRILDLVIDDVHSHRQCAVHTVLDYFRPRSRCCSFPCSRRPIAIHTAVNKFLSPPAALRPCPLLPAAAPCAQSGRCRSFCTPWRCIQAGKIFIRLISVPVRRRDSRMAISGPPHSGESLASCVAARHASAFVLESRSSLHAFHALSPCVMWVSGPRLPLPTSTSAPWATQPR